MLLNSKIILFFFFFSIVFLSCRKDPIPPKEVTLNQGDYNLKVGNKWIYLISKIPQNDTMILEIISKVSLPNFATKYNCLISRTDKIVEDTGYFLESGNRLTYQGNNQNWSYYANFALEFPIVKNEAWLGF